MTDALETEAEAPPVNGPPPSDCYVFDAVLDGGIDLAKWDGLVPSVADADGATLQERTHEPARKFVARLGGEHDPLTLDGYAKHWKEKRHLTALPNEASFDPLVGLPAGAWIQRLVETVEIQAVLIEQLNQRIKALETGTRATPWSMIPKSGCRFSEKIMLQQ